MSKDRMKEAADRQVEKTARELPEEHREKKETKRIQRTERLVIRLSKDELRRIAGCFKGKDLPVSTGCRSVLLDYARRA